MDSIQLPRTVEDGWICLSLLTEILSSYRIKILRNFLPDATSVSCLSQVGIYLTITARHCQLLSLLVIGSAWIS